MTSRGRYNQSQDWDPMREDYDTTYDAQYPDDEVSSGGVQLDHCKLYVTNIPKAINEEGLRTAFAAYGNLLKIYLSKDPNKRYALITYEAASEARLAMMKLNRTEPLKFNIHIAHKKNDSQQSQPKERRYNNKNSNYETDGNHRNDTGTYSYRNDSSSVSSRERQNLLKKGDTENKDTDVVEPAAPAPLRRPHSPAAVKSPKREFHDENDRPRKNYFPAGDAAQMTNQKPQNRGNNKGYKPQTFRRPMNQNDANDEEEKSFEPKVEPKPAVQPTPVPKPKPTESVPSTSYQPAKSGPKSETVPYQPVKSTTKPETVPYKPVKDETKSEPVTSHPPVKKEPVTARVETVPEVKQVVAPVTDTTPARKLVPANYLIETLSIGDQVLLSVDRKASGCHSKSSGYVCLSLHEKSELDYQLLCEDFTMDCETAQDCKPNPGDLFSYRNPEDGAYYRARCLNPTSAALIDSSKIVPLSPTDKCKVTPLQYEAIAEFCCVLDAPNIKIGDSVMITLKSKSPEGYNVQIENAEAGAAEGAVSRWMPPVEYPVPKPVPAVPVIPEVPRPDVKNNSTVLLVEGDSVDRVLVRPADSESMMKFDMVLQDVLQFSMKASPIKEPPQKGQVVIGKFSDGNCYRALVKRINVKANKYQLEYIEFGNIEVNTRETIYACPQQLDLNSIPTLVSVVKLQVNANALTPPATQYIEHLRDNNVELVLSLPDGSKTAPSGSEVLLSVAKNKESVNKKIELMCTPDWKKIEEKGGDVLDSERLMLSDVEERDLPEGGCEIEIRDVSTITVGVVCGCQHVPGASAALDALTRQMEEYCNSEIGKEPYLPIVEELCIAQFPPDPRWYRAVVCEQLGGPGGSEVRVCYIDYGNLETVPVTALRKMLPEFVRGYPAMASHIEIQGFPASPTNEMLARAAMHMNIDEEGRGTLKVARCVKSARGVFTVEAPDLLKAMGVK